MGFILLSEDSKPPDWPHIVCAGSGFAWHEQRTKRACYTGEVSVDAAMVSAAINGHELAGIDRVIAIRRVYEESPGAVLSIFSMRCRASRCGGNHYERARKALCAMREYVHPDAISALRDAEVPEWLITQPRLLGSKQETKVKKKKDSKPHNGMPVWVNDSERTRLAQIAFAIQYAAQRRCA